MYHVSSSVATPFYIAILNFCCHCVQSGGATRWCILMLAFIILLALVAYILNIVWRLCVLYDFEDILFSFLFYWQCVIPPSFLYNIYVCHFHSHAGIVGELTRAVCVCVCSLCQWPSTQSGKKLQKTPKSVARSNDRTWAGGRRTRGNLRGY